MKKISLNDWLQERNQMIISASFLNKVFPVNDKFIDTQTSKDLLLDEYYKKIDKAITTPGRNTLYYLLHSPLENQQDIKKRVSFLQIIRKNKILSEKIQKSLYRVKFDRFHSIDAIMINEKNFLFNRLQLFTIIFLFILMIIVIPVVYPKFAFFTIFGFFIISFINFIKHYHTFNTYIPSIIKLHNHYTAAKKIKNSIPDNISHPYLESLSSSILKIKKLIPLLKILKTGSVISTDPFGLLLFWIKNLFCLDLLIFNRVLVSFKENYNELKEFYFNYGLIDALISFSKELDLSDIHTETVFHDTNKVTFKDIYHPLLAKPVKNNLIIENTLIITGSNMAGKSTLLRTIGLNCILSQCIGFSYSSFCEMPITKIISIINKHDDLQYGESFYYYEAKRISSMINKKEEGYYLFLIDELLSGTNSLERVSASIAIIEYLLKKEYIISIIATHDIAIADRLSEKCTCCYLSDKIEGSRMTFDYKLKPGIIRTTNAIKMLELLGLPAEIIQNSKSNQKSLY